MPKEAYIHTRIDPNIKEMAELVFAKIGLSLTDAVSLFLTQVTLRNGLPFPLTIPAEDMDYQENRSHLIASQKAKLNAMLQEAEDEIAAGQGLTPEQAKARTGAFLKNLRAKKQGTDEITR
jgi:addiction module RelB/DinJ family antitoxin